LIVGAWLLSAVGVDEHAQSWSTIIKTITSAKCFAYFIYIFSPPLRFL